MYIHLVVKHGEVIGCWSSETDALKHSRKIIGSKITKMKLNTEKQTIHQTNNTQIDPTLFHSWKEKYRKSS